MRRIFSPFHGTRARQRGSAMVVAILVMLLLMTLGLSLVLVTEIEMLLGGTERVITNNLYAAESGVHAALAGILVTQDWGGEEFAVLEGTLGANQNVGHRVRTSRVQAVGPPQAPPLTIANEGENDFHSFSVVMRSVSQRVAWPSTETSPIYEAGDLRENDVYVQAQSTQTVTYFLSPIQRPTSPGSLYNEDDVVNKVD